MIRGEAEVALAALIRNAQSASKNVMDAGKHWMLSLTNAMTVTKVGIVVVNVGEVIKNG